MLDIVFGILMFLVFGKLALFAIKATWNIFKILMFLVCLPAIIIIAFIKGLFVIAWPLLIIVAVISLFKTIKEA